MYPGFEAMEGMEVHKTEKTAVNAALTAKMPGNLPLTGIRSMISGNR